MSGLGVRIPAVKRISITACFLYFLMNSGLRIPIFERKNETIGNSNTSPAASIADIMKLKYSLTAIMFSIEDDPNVAKNESAVGSNTKYENTIPAKKQSDENITIEEIYFLSLGFNAGSINFHN